MNTIKALNQAQNSTSPFARVVRWIAVVPVGFGILWIVEVLLNLIIDWGLSWRLDGWGYLLVFFGSGIVVLVSIILAARLAAHTTTRIAPRPRKGLILLGTVYLVAQVIRFYYLLGEPDSIWQNVVMKIEFAVVVSVVFLIAYRGDEIARESEEDEEDVAQ